MIMINRLFIIQTCNYICFDASKMSSTTSNLVMIFDRNFHYTIQLQLVIISSSRKEPCAFRLDLNIDVQGNNTFSTSFLEELEMIIRQHVHQHPKLSALR